MKKAILEYDNEYDTFCAMNGHKFKRALQEMDEYLRNKIKYAPDGFDTRHYQDIRDMLNDICNSLDADYSYETT